MGLPASLRRRFGMKCLKCLGCDLTSLFWVIVHVERVLERSEKRQESFFNARADSVAFPFQPKPFSFHAAWVETRPRRFRNLRILYSFYEKYLSQCSCNDRRAGASNSSHF